MFPMCLRLHDKYIRPSEILGSTQLFPSEYDWSELYIILKTYLNNEAYNNYNIADL